MFKICDSEVVEPLPLIYKNYIDSGISPAIKKMINILLTITIVSLLPICSKIFECTIYNPVFLYLENNKLLTTYQSGFHPNDSCIHQLISIVQHFYSNFDHNSSLEVRGYFLDISKMFDKVYMAWRIAMQTWISWYIRKPCKSIL